MVMKQLSNVTTKRPFLVVLIIILITGLLGAEYIIGGFDMEADEDTYLPDNDIVNANTEISEKFGAIDPVSSLQILVKSQDGNILTKEAFLEILNLEKAILEDSEFSEVLYNENQSVISVVDTILIGKQLLDSIDMMNQSFQMMNTSLVGMDGLVSYYDNMIDIDTILSVNASLSENVSLFSSGFSYGSMSSSMSSIGMTIDEKIENITAMSDENITDLIDSLVNYENIESEDAKDCANEITTTTISSLIGKITAFDGTLTALLTNSTVNSTSSLYNATISMQYICSMLNGTIAGLQYMILSMDVDNTIMLLDKSIESTGYGIPMMLTNDFDSETDLTAKATLILVMFNATTLPDETSNEKSDRFLDIEMHLTDILEDQNLSVTVMSVFGMNLINNEIMDVAMDSMSILLPLCFLIIIFILIIIYRNLFDLFISLLALVFAVIWVYGFAVLLNFTFNPMTIVVPILIVGLGIDYGIHVTLRYREEIRKGVKSKEATGLTIRSVGVALLLTTITTVISFMSNMFSEMGIIAEFGILCAIGVIGSFIVMTTFVPACRQIRDTRKEKKGKEVIKDRKNGNNKIKSSGIVALNKGLGFGATAAEHHPIPVIGIVLLLTGAAYFGGVVNLNTEFDFMDFLPKELEITKDIEYITDNFNYSEESANILIKGDLTNPAILIAINDTLRNMNDDDYVIKENGNMAKTESILSIIEDVATDETINDPFDIYSEEFEQIYQDSLVDSDDIPDTNITILYDWLYENGTTCSLIMGVLHREGDNYDSCIISVTVNTNNARNSGEVYEELLDDVQPLDILVDNGILTEVTVTGSAILTHVIMETLNESMMISMIITILAALLILTVIFLISKKSFVLGIITTLPVLLVLVWILGTMYLLNIPYNVITITVTALTIGLGISYSIHITSRFIEELNNFDDIDKACRHAVVNTGTALFGSTATTVAGFGLLVFSVMPPMQQFGIVISLTILYSFLVSVFILPTFLVLWAKTKKRKEQKIEKADIDNTDLL